MIRRAWVILLIFFISGIASAQTDTPTPTATPTETPTATITPDLSIYVTVIAPGGSPEESVDGALRFEVTAGQVMQAALVIVLVVLAVMDLILRMRGRGGD